MPNEGRAPEWPRRLREISGRLRGDQSGPPRERARGEAWSIVHAAISSYLRHHATKGVRPPREDLEDLAAQKSLEVARRLESGDWNVAGSELHSITGFLSTVARNALADWWRESKRRVAEEEADLAPPLEPPGADPRADRALGRRDFAEALRGCAEPLEARSRTAWLFRVFYDMPTKQIAAHPEIGLKPGHVDVLLQRVRGAIRDCLDRKGFGPEDVARGAFVEIWEAFRLGGAATDP